MKLTKVARGIQYGDVSNMVVRNILTQIGMQVYGKFTELDLEETLEYFEYKCPYTGKNLKTCEYAMDHIVPQNKEYCGLNVKGNLVLVDKHANSVKGSRTVDDFLKNDTEVLGNTPMEIRMERLQKIKDFQKLCGYNPEEITKKISAKLSEIYDEIREEQEQRISDLIALSGLTPLTPVVSVSNQVVNKKQKFETELIFYPSDLNLFKKELINKKKATIILTYDTGRVKTIDWVANNFSVDSDLKGNIQSKSFWRTRKSDGLIKVEVKL